MSNKNYQPFWDEALKQICEEYKQKGNEDEFNIWFKLDYIEDESNVIKTKVPSEFMRQQIISHGYVEQIKNKVINNGILYIISPIIKIDGIIKITGRKRKPYIKHTS